MKVEQAWHGRFVFLHARVRAHKEGEGYNTQERNEAAGKKQKANERTNLVRQGGNDDQAREKEKGGKGRRMGKRA